MPGFSELAPPVADYALGLNPSCPQRTWESLWKHVDGDHCEICAVVSQIFIAMNIKKREKKIFGRLHNTVQS